MRHADRARVVSGEEDRLPRPDGAPRRATGGDDDGHQHDQERSEAPQPLHRRLGVVHPGEHMHRRDGARRRPGGCLPAAQQEQLRPQEGCAVQRPHRKESSRPSRRVCARHLGVALRQAPRRFTLRGDPGAGAVRPGPGARDALSKARPGAGEDPDVLNPSRVLGGTRRGRARGSVFAGEAAPAARQARRGGRGRQRRHVGRPGQRRVQYRRLQERGERHPLRSRQRDHRDGIRGRPSGAGGEHPRKVPRQQGQQHPVRRAQHPRQGGRGRHAGRSEAQAHDRRVRQGFRRHDPKVGAATRVRARERFKHQDTREGAPGLPRRRRRGVQI